MAIKQVSRPEIDPFFAVDHMSHSDFVLLMRLLDEFTQKYRNILSDKANISYVWLYDFAPHLGLLLIFGVGFLGMQSLRTTNNALETAIYIGLGAALLAGMLSTLFVAFKFRRDRINTLQLSTVIFLDARLITLIKVASQLYEHGTLTDMQKLELDLRLAEAESVLHVANKNVPGLAEDRTEFLKDGLK